MSRTCRRLWRRAASCLLAVSVLGTAAFCQAGETRTASSFSPEKKREILDRLRVEAGGATALLADFVQETTVPDAPGSLFARGRLVARKNGSLRWEYAAPARVGYLAEEGMAASWGGTGREAEKPVLRKNAEATAAAGFIVACLIVDERVLRKHCLLEVCGENPPAIRLVPANEHVRGYVSEATLTFSPDGSVLDSVRVATARNGTSLFTFGNIVRNEVVPRDRDALERLLASRPEQTIAAEARGREGRGALFSALLTENGRKLPLLLWAWDEMPGGAQAGAEQGAPRIRCSVFTEIFLLLGTVVAGPEGITSRAAVPDSRADQALAHVGRALWKLFPKGLGIGSVNGALRHAERGWSLQLSSPEARP